MVSLLGVIIEMAFILGIFVLSNHFLQGYIRQSIVLCDGRHQKIAGELPPTSGIQAIHVRLSPRVTLHRWMLARGSDQQSVVEHGHRATEGASGDGITRRELNNLLPYSLIVRPKDISSARPKSAAHRRCVVLRTNEHGLPANAHGNSEVVEVQPVAGDELGLLAPALLVTHEDIGGTGLSRRPWPERGADDNQVTA